MPETLKMESAALWLTRVCAFSPLMAQGLVASYIIMNSAAVWSFSSEESNTVLLAMVCLSPLKHAAAHRHATFSTAVPLVPHVAPGELTRSKRNACGNREVCVW